MLEIQLGNWVYYRNPGELSATRGIVRWFDDEYAIIEENQYCVQKIQRKYIKKIIEEDDNDTEEFDMKFVNGIYYEE